MDPLDPENLGKTEEEHPVHQQKPQRRDDGAGRRYRLKKSGEQQQKKAADHAPAEPDDIGTNERACLLGGLIAEGRKERGRNDKHIPDMPARCLREENNQRSGEHERPAENLSPVQRFVTQEKSEEEKE